VDGQEAPAAEAFEGGEGVLGAEVDLAPRGVERAHFEHHEVEAPEARADVVVLGGEPGVAAEEDPVPR
jgi:hypothetical protein